MLKEYSNSAVMGIHIRTVRTDFCIKKTVLGHFQNVSTVKKNLRPKPAVPVSTIYM